MAWHMGGRKDEDYPRRERETDRQTDRQTDGQNDRRAMLACRQREPAIAKRSIQAGRQAGREGARRGETYPQLERTQRDVHARTRAADPSIHPGSLWAVRRPFG